MDATAVFPAAKPPTGMYESFFLRAVAPDKPLGVWLRYTVHKAPSERPWGSVWCTVFDRDQPAPFMDKITTDELSVPPGGWIAIGPDAAIGSREAHGTCGQARWSIQFETAEADLHHLWPNLLYGTPVPRTKLTSPAPAATLHGSLTIPGRAPIDLEGWRGMVGHNWGAEHAERWVWLNGVGFDEDPTAWLDVAIGRLRVGGRLTPWIANGAISLDGRRYRLGGLLARGLEVTETAGECIVKIPGQGGLVVHGRLGAPGGTTAGWRYADPRGGEHDVLNCSIASVELAVDRPGMERTSLHSDHGGVYELGTRDHEHGVPIAPFSDD